MIDISPTTVAKSDILNADDLIGKTITVKITKVSKISGDQPIAINFEGDNGKPFMPCKSMRRVLQHVWGSDGAKYVGKSLTLYRDPEVTFGGLKVGGVRISHMSDIKEKITMALTASKANKKPYAVLPLSVEQPSPMSDSILAAGNDAASRGVVAYTEWKDSLAPAIKSTIRPMHEAWTEKARAADKAGGF